MGHHGRGLLGNKKQEVTTIKMKSTKRRTGGDYIMNGSEIFSDLPIERNLALEGKLDRARKSLPYKIEYTQGAFADDLWQAMEHRRLNQVEFAEKAGVAKQFLTKIFRGGNCTIETMVKLAFALDYKLSIHLSPRTNVGY